MSNRKNKRLQFITDFFEECEPQSEEDLHTVYKTVDIMRYLRRVFQSSTSKTLQSSLCKEFDLINQVFGVASYTKQQEEPDRVIYIGLHDALLQQKQELQMQIKGLEEALAYARLRQNNPKQNMIYQFQDTNFT